ncbi:MAG: oxidoreductase [Alphaproteobacteria bacterium]|nr:MAG: oxidoreductase [Alphaproteobacteria bacterium]
MSGKVKIGIIGAGWWAVDNHIPALIAHGGAELTGVCRRGEKELTQVKERFGFAHASTCYKELLENVEMDAVIISSPHFLHYEHAKAALLKGCHVLVEKPFTTNAGQARELVEIAQEQSKAIMVPCGWNFSPMGLKANEIIKNVGIGEVKHVVLQMASALADLFAGEPMVETSGSMFRPPASTWADPEKAGGYGWGQFSHALSLFYQLFDLSPLKIQAICGTSQTGVDCYDAAIVHFNNGATGVLSGAATVPKQCGFQMDIRVFGTEGMFLFDVERERVEIRRHDGNDVILELEKGEGAYNGMRPVTHFVDYCLGKTNSNPSSGAVALQSIETLAMMYRELKIGQQG